MGLRWDDGRAIEILAPPGGRKAHVSHLRWIRQAWIPIAGLRYDFSYIDQYGQQIADQTRLAVDLATRNQVGVPRQKRPMKLMPLDTCTVLPRWTASQLAQDVDCDWKLLMAGIEPAEIGRLKDRLEAQGVPPVAETLTITVEGVFLLPIYAALLDNGDGERIQVVEGTQTYLDRRVSEFFTANRSALAEQLLTGRALRGVPGS